jgi:hypothetical protein
MPPPPFSAPEERIAPPPVFPAAPPASASPSANHRDVIHEPSNRGDIDAFAHAPPFRPKINPTKRWTMAAAAGAVLLIGGIGAVQYFGTPNLAAKLGLPGGYVDVPLLLEVPIKPERRLLESGNELFAIRGKVVNPTADQQRVPDILAELRDAQGRVVYGWTITPPKRTIAAKGSIEFNSAEVNVPKGAKELNLSFSGL